MHSISKGGVYTPFCDWLTVTVPPDESFDLDRALRPLLVEAGAVPQPWGFRLTSATATVAVKSPHRVCIWSFSGEAVNDLREAGLWGAVLAEIGARPHRVTRLDVAIDTADVSADVLPALEEKGHRGELHLSRKAVDPKRMQWQRSMGLTGRVSGTVYAGKRGVSRVVGRAYDKRLHVVEKLGQEDPGVEWTRYELELSVPGLTVGDAYAPERVFWAYGSEFCGRPVPEGVEAWEPHGEGYVLPPRRERSLYEVLERRIEQSEELGALRSLAESMGDGGLRALRRMMLERLGLPA